MGEGEEVGEWAREVNWKKKIDVIWKVKTTISFNILAYYLIFLHNKNI